MEIELRQVVRAAVRWGWLIVVATVLSGVLAFAVTRGQTATYSATTTVLVNADQVIGRAQTAELQASRTQAETYVLLVNSGPVLDRVIEGFDLEYTRNHLAEKIDASVVINTQIIEISVSDASAEEAARLANGVAAEFDAYVEQLTIGGLQERLDDTRAEIDTLRARQAEIDAELAEIDTDDNADNADIQAQIRELQEERSRAAETIADLDGTIRRINADLATFISPLEVADQATAAREPDSPRPALMTVLGLFLGFLVGCGLAAVLAFTDRKIRPETDIEALTDARLLGVVPLDRKLAASTEPFVLSHPDSPAAETIRMLRAHLTGVTRSENHWSIVVTDAGNAGASSDIIANLGIVMAQSGRKTVVVDANLRSPKQHQLFDVDNASGLSDALSGVSLECRQTAAGPGVIPAGASSGHPARLVSSAAFDDLIRDIRARANLVLIDVPPAREYSDALNAASVTDGVILIGRYNATTRDDLAALADTFREGGICLLGVVMIRG